MARKAQRRDAATGRFVHQWGVVAQDARGDIERCPHCDRYRLFGYEGRQERRIDPTTIAEEAWL